MSSMKFFLLLIFFLSFQTVKAAPVAGVSWEAIATISGDETYNGLSDGGLTFSAGWDFPGLLAIDLFYKHFNLEKDIEKPAGKLKANLDTTLIGPMIRIHHGLFVDSRLSLFYSKIESDYRTTANVRVPVSAEGTFLGVLTGGEGHFKVWKNVETFLGCDLMFLGGEILSLSLDLGLRSTF